MRRDKDTSRRKPTARQSRQGSHASGSNRQENRGAKNSSSAGRVTRSARGRPVDSRILGAWIEYQCTAPGTTRWKPDNSQKPTRLVSNPLEKRPSWSVLARKYYGDRRFADHVRKGVLRLQRQVLDRIHEE